MELLLKLLALVSVAFWILSCDSNEPQTNFNLSLTLEDVSCTEAWLQLTSTNIQLPNNINLLVNDTVKKTFTLNTQDSLLYIDSLLPNQTYKLQVSSIHNPVSSNELSITTMDTTSHNFTWQTFAFGENSSSTLYDVAIINENNIWAVGEIYMNDSLGNPDPNLYNIIKWDGINWKPERVYYNDNQGQSFLAPIKSIFAFNLNDIWLGSDIVFHWDGTIYKSIVLPDAVFNNWINKIWGSSSSDLYVVGDNGSIAHYQNGNWSKIESGTTLNINDIWGDFNEKTQEWEILVVASDQAINSGCEILKINLESVLEISNSGLPWSLASIYFKPNKKYIVGGDGLFDWDKNLNRWIKFQDLPLYYITKIRGNISNDLFVVGAYGLLLHFNGYSWYNFQDIFFTNTSAFGSVDFKDGVCCVIGGRDNKQVIIIGKR